jgi:hypothetical protein
MSYIAIQELKTAPAHIGSIVRHLHNEWEAWAVPYPLPHHMRSWQSLAEINLSMETFLPPRKRDMLRGSERGDVSYTQRIRVSLSLRTSSKLSRFLCFNSTKDAV